MKPWVDKNYSAIDNVIFQQDGAPAHTAQKAHDWLKANFTNFLSMTEWPPSSTDLNLLDYSVWATSEAEAYETVKCLVAQLKASVMSAWEKMTQSYIIAPVHN